MKRVFRHAETGISVQEEWTIKLNSTLEEIAIPSRRNENSGKREPKNQSTRFETRATKNRRKCSFAGVESAIRVTERALGGGEGGGQK